MKKFTCKIDITGAALRDDPEHELARCLQKVATQVHTGRTEGKVLDINGNTVGEWKITGR